MVAGTTTALGPVSAYADNLGTTVTNIATMTYDDFSGDKRVTVLTNPASFLIEAERTESTIDFFRFSPNDPKSQLVNINGSDFSPSGALNGPFIGVNPNSSGAQQAIGSSANTAQGVPLSPASVYNAGELMFVRVNDAGQNGDPNVIETVTITVVTSTGDSITLKLYESGVDTGEFWAFLPSTRDASPVNDTVLTTVRGTELTATYVDSFDSTEISIDTALVDPLNRVFNGLTGDLVNNATVTLIDAQTGAPATVFGIDGFSDYPATIISGSTITDTSGLAYALRQGEFQFPIVPPGEYYLQVDPPEGLSFASSLQADDFSTLTTAPYSITDGSYGRSFTQEFSGPLLLDIPLDAESEFIVTKTTQTSFGDIGDFVGYTVTVENRGQAGAPVVLVDDLPQGFRYVADSSTINGRSFANPVISDDGGTLTFNAGPLLVNETVELNYVLKIGADVRRGEAVNEIVAIDGNGNNVSNISRVGITIREDLMRTHSTVIGRIAENACDGDEEWSREIYQGKGVAGVRLYMETGSYAISDEDGLYHFEGVKAGVHVVQVDEETLPKGYEVMVCEENTRYAGSAISKFIDTKGAGIWRANFYLKRTGDTAVDEVIAEFNDQTEYKKFDAEWLGTQTDDPQWAYPQPERTPSIPSVNIGIKHGPQEKVELSLNGRPVPLQNFSARDSDNSRKVMMSRWRGVDILDGRNEFVATVKTVDGNVVKTIRKEIHFVKNIARASAIPDQSSLVADGRSFPELAIRLEDEAGRPVHAGRIATIDVPAPYRLHNPARLEGEEEIVSPLSARANINVGPDGIAKVKLDPTLKTGKVTVIVTLDNGRQIPLFMYLEPEKRDWILVGLAEGSAAYNSLKNKTAAMAAGSAEDLVTDGRVAFFAKGLVKGDWLLTLAIDSDKRRGDRDGDFQQEIDPNAYYTIYGDRSFNEFEAQSRYPVYVKLEKKSFYAMFGDYDTNITEGKLTRYSRRLSGVKSEYLGEAFQAMGFAAETNQGFAKDELAANGTSGPYRLTHQNILSNSETITIETRDRVRADRVLSTRRLLRHLDYTLDTITGEIIFRLPVDVTDSAFNPNVIVVDYETQSDAERNYSYGGRVQTQILDRKVQIGSTFVHEGGNNNIVDGEADMVGADLIAQISDGTEFRAEYAVSRTKDATTNGDFKTSKAYLGEVVHTGENLTAGVYIRQEEGGFGLGQRSTNTAEIRRYGADAAYKFAEFENEETGRRGSRNVAASLYREENLGTGANRTSSEVSVSQESEIFSASAGLRQIKDKFETGENRESLLATGSVRYALPKHGATFQVSHEQPLSSKDGVSDYPQRTRLAVDKTLTKKASVHITHDIIDGATTGGQNTTMGVSYQPWAGTQVTLGSDMVTQDSGRRIGATVGVDQQVQLSEKWSVSAGLSNRRILKQAGPIEQVAPDAAISGFEVNDNFTAAYVGAGYRTEKTSMTARLEGREASQTKSYTATLGSAREVSEELSFAGAVRANLRKERIQVEPGVNEGFREASARRVDARLGAAWRPRDEDTVLLNRLDLSFDETTTGDRTVKVVNNLATNTRITDRWQLSTQYGVKYIDTNFAGQSYSGTSHLLGAETRFDVTERIDLGLSGSILIDPSSGTKSYAYGPSIGVSPVDNVWISAGYNVDGFIDKDFEAAEYSRKGPYIQFRFKFDQNTARGLLDVISPKSD